MRVADVMRSLILFKGLLIEGSIGSPGVAPVGVIEDKDDAGIILFSFFEPRLNEIYTILLNFAPLNFNGAIAFCT